MIYFVMLLRSRSTGKAKRIMPAPPPLPSAAGRQPSLRREGSAAATAAAAPPSPREDQVEQIAIVSSRVLFFLVI
jgi:hypothetical protein